MLSRVCQQIMQTSSYEMAMIEKFKPWYDDFIPELWLGSQMPKAKHLFNVTSEEINLCLSLLNEIDMGGLIFNPLYINKKGFVIGVFFEVFNSNCDSNIDEFLDLFCSKIQEGVNFLFMPSSDLTKPIEIDEYEAVKDFSPPCIAKGLAKKETIHAVVATAIKDYTGSFYCFSREVDFIVLFVSGHYCMVAGEREFVEDVFGRNYKDSWKPVIDGRVDILKLPSLVNVLKEYNIV